MGFVYCLFSATMLADASKGFYSILSYSTAPANLGTMMLNPVGEIRLARDDRAGCLGYRYHLSDYSCSSSGGDHIGAHP